MSVETFTVDITAEQAFTIYQAIQSYLFTISSAIPEEQFIEVMKQMHPVQGQLISIRDESLRKKYSDLNQTPETLDRIFQEFIDEANTK
ncbi:MAG: hypothetical protein IJE78_05580 [Bacteroidaceae bacterium]|nr:hypothetical protein [Bacteroidaceae bacterium]